MKNTLSDVIDDLGFGLCQIRLTFIAGGVYTIGGEVLFLFAILPYAIGKELSLTPYERASIGSVVFIGMLLGNISSMSNDQVGRRLPILAAFLGILVCSASSAVAYTLVALLILWGLTGLSYGLGVPAWNALCSETTPTEWRFSMNALSMMIFPVGSLYACFLVYMYAPDMESVDKHWRTILILGRIPNVILLVLGIVPGFVESAHWYASKGRVQEAEKELAVMREQNGKPDVSIEFEHTPTAAADCDIRASFGVLLSRSYLPTMVMVGLTTYILNFVGYGFMYALPHVLTSVELGMSPVLTIMIATVTELAGYWFALWLETLTGRRTMMMVYLSTSIFCAAIFALGISALRADSHSEAGVWFLQGGLNGLKFFGQAGWLVAYVYMGEAFPTTARCTASGMCIGFGRLGALSAPWLFEHLLITTGSHHCYFAMLVVAMVVNLIVAAVVMEETKGLPLAEIEASKEALAAVEDGHKPLKDLHI